MFNYGEIRKIIDTITDAHPAFDSNTIILNLQNLRFQHAWSKQQIDSLNFIANNRFILEHIMEDFSRAFSDAQAQKIEDKRSRVYLQTFLILKLQHILTYREDLTRAESEQLSQVSEQLTLLFQDSKHIERYLNACFSQDGESWADQIKELGHDISEACDQPFWLQFIRKYADDKQALDTVFYAESIEKLLKIYQDHFRKKIPLPANIKKLIIAIAEEPVKKSLKYKPKQNPEKLRQSHQKQVYKKLISANLNQFSARELHWLAIFSKYPRAGEHPQAAKLLYDLKIDNLQFIKYLALRSRIRTSDKALPSLVIRGEMISCPGYSLIKISPHDPIAAFLGYPTGCCQSLGGAAESSVIHGLTSESSGFYALVKGKLPAGPVRDTQYLFKHKQIIAQAWVWRSGEHVVFDNIEGNAQYHQTAHQRRITKHMFSILAQALGKADPTIKTIRVGETEIVSAGYRAVLPKDLITVNARNCYSDAELSQYYMYDADDALEQEAVANPAALLARFSKKDKPFLFKNPISVFKLLLQHPNQTFVRQFFHRIDIESQQHLAKAMGMHLSTALHLAVMEENPVLISDLLVHQADIHAVDLLNCSALSIAIDQSNIPIIVQLLESGASLAPKNQIFPLVQAVQDNNSDVVRLLLKHGANPNVVDEHGMSALRIAIANHYVDIVLALIEYHVDCEQPIAEYHNLLNWATHHQYYGVMQLLIHKGVSLKTPLFSHTDPIAYALYRQDLVGADILLRAGANCRQINYQSESLLPQLVLGDKINSVRYYYEHVESPDIQSTMFQKALLRACSLNHFTLLDYLLGHIPQIARYKTHGNTGIIMFLINHGIVEATKHILRQYHFSQEALVTLFFTVGAVNLPNWVDFFITLGVPVDSKNHAGKTLMQVAREFGYDELANQLAHKMMRSTSPAQGKRLKQYSYESLKSPPHQAHQVIHEEAFEQKQGIESRDATVSRGASP